MEPRSHYITKRQDPGYIESRGNQTWEGWLTQLVEGHAKTSISRREPWRSLQWRRGFRETTKEEISSRDQLEGT
jgi:hypothetical protein